MNKASNSKFATRKWNIANEKSKSNFDPTNKITYNTEILKSNLCDDNDAYILVKGDITTAAAPAKQVGFKNCSQFTKCITKIDGTTLDDAEDLDLVMSMYNLIEYSSNYSETKASLWLYFEDEGTYFNADIVNNHNFQSIKFKLQTELLRLIILLMGI